MSNDIPIGTLVHYKDKAHMKPGAFAMGVVSDVYRRPDGVIKSLALKTPCNKNLIIRDLRACYMAEHDFLKITEAVHQCLLSK